MKQIVIILVLAAVLTVGYLLYKSTPAPEDSTDDQTQAINETTREPVLFHNNETGDFTVIYSDDANTARLIMTNQEYELARSETASGSQYKSADGSIVFRESGGQGQVEIDGELLTYGEIASVGDVKTDDENSEPEMVDEVPGDDIEDANELSATAWQWETTNYEDGKTVTPTDPESFVLAFSGTEQFSASTDCNNLTGNYEIESGNLSFGQIAATKKACPTGSQEAEFTQMLATADSYTMVESGNLEVMIEGGTMVLTPTVVELEVQ